MGSSDRVYGDPNMQLFVFSGPVGQDPAFDLDLMRVDPDFIELTRNPGPGIGTTAINGGGYNSDPVAGGAIIWVPPMT